MTELHCVVAGRVQGVAYRAFAVSIAQELGLKGYVANLPDGSVEVLAQGEYTMLKVLVNHLRKGPPLSQITGFTEEWQDEPSKVYTTFETA